MNLRVDVVSLETVQRFLVGMAERLHALLLRLPKNAFHRIETLVQVLQGGTKREAHEMVARRVEEVTTVRGVDVEEDARDDDRLFLEELLEEGQAVVERRGEFLEVEPDVERRVGGDGDGEADVLETLEHVVALGLEVLLESDLLLRDMLRVKEGDGRELERVVGTTIQEGTRLRERGDQVLGTDNPAAAPARKTPVLGQAIDDDDRVDVHVFHVFSGRNGGAQRFVIDVPRVKLVKNKSDRLLPAELDEVLEFLTLDNLTSRVTGV